MERDPIRWDSLLSIRSPSLWWESSPRVPEDIGNRRETPSEGIGWREGTERDPRSIRRPVPSMERPETACEDSGRVGGETISERPEEVGNSNRPQGNESPERYSISFRFSIIRP